MSIFSCGSAWPSWSRRSLLRQWFGLVIALAPLVVSGLASAEDLHYRVDQRLISIHVNADGTSRTETYEVTSLLTDTGIEWYGEESVYFSADSQSAEVLEAYTELPDGTRIEVKHKAIRLTEADSPGQGSYSDSKAHVVIFPQLVNALPAHSPC